MRFTRIREGGVGGGAGNDLPDGGFQFFGRLSTTITADAFGQHGADFLKEPNLREA